ncbi:hypothetical protein JCM15519_21120 [Fundidesulfovibrio butyratiphilus]
MSSQEKDNNVTMRDNNNSSEKTKRDIYVDVQDETEHIFMSLPEALAGRYRIEKEMQARGAEADISLVRCLSDNIVYVAKIYRSGIRPKAEVLDWLKKADPKFVIRQIENGESNGRCFEVMEYAPFGSLRNLLNREKASLPPDRVKEILCKLTQAIAYLLSQSPNVIHRDIKPENVLVRSLTPLDLALTDFGIASELEFSQRFTSAHRTLKYSSPELMVGAISSATDWWSLGMILIEALTGKHPFDGMPEQAINNALYEHRPIDFSLVNDENWEKLFRGLLRYNVKERWGEAEVARWLDNDPHLPLLGDESPVGQTRKVQPYILGGVACSTKAELAQAMRQNWNEALKRVGRVSDLLRWFQTELADHDLINFFQDLTENNAIPVDFKLSMLVSVLDPSLPLLLEGKECSREILCELGRMAYEGDEHSMMVVDNLYALDLLAIFAEISGNKEYSDIAMQWKSTVDSLQHVYKVIDSIQFTRNLLPEHSMLCGALLTAASVLGWQDVRRSKLKPAWSSPVIEACPWINRLPLLQEASIPWLVVFPLIEKEAYACGKASIRRKRRKKLIVCLAVVVVAFAVITTSVIWVRHRIKVKEASAWEFAKKTQTEKSFSDYLAEFPEGLHVKKALDGLEWAKIRDGEDVEVLKGYLRDHLKSDFAINVRERIDRLDWARCLKENSVHSYEEYVVAHPRGAYVDEARKIADDLKWELTLADNTIGGFNKYINEFGLRRHKDEATEKLQYLKDNVYLSAVPFIDWKDVISMKANAFYRDRKIDDSLVDWWIGITNCQEWLETTNPIKKLMLRQDAEKKLFSYRYKTRVRASAYMDAVSYDLQKQELFISPCDSERSWSVNSNNPIYYLHYTPKSDPNCYKDPRRSTERPKITIRTGFNLKPPKTIHLSPEEVGQLVEKLHKTNCRHTNTLGEVFVDVVADINPGRGNGLKQVEADIVSAYVWTDSSRTKLIGTLGNASPDKAR